MGVTITQLLSIARVKVLANKEIIIFVISFPRPKLLCKKITAFPVSHARRIFHLLDNTVADCEGSITAVILKLISRGLHPRFQQNTAGNIILIFLHYSADVYKRQ